MFKHVITLAGALAVALAAAAPAAAAPQDDIERFQHYYLKKFPKVPKEEFANGVYAIDPVGRANWEAIEEFPPYEPVVDEGRKLWETPFANGKTYASCFPDGPAQQQNYPRWDKERGTVMTLAWAVNLCREANGEKPLGYMKGPMASLLAFMAYESRGQTVAVQIPTEDPRATEAFNKGKQFWFTRRGKLNFACVHCHGANSGNAIRTEVLSVAFGHATHWPVYRAKWGDTGTLYRRFAECNDQVGAKGLDGNSEEYRNLEYFLTAVSNGLHYNGPAARK